VDELPSYAGVEREEYDPYVGHIFGSSFFVSRMQTLTMYHSPKVPTRFPSFISTSVAPFLQVGVRSYGIWTSR
jgi:hypothetical protein